MSRHVSQASALIVAVLGTALTIGCGLDGSWSDFEAPDRIDGESGEQATSTENIALQLQQPTGTVDASTAMQVAEAFAAADTSGLDGSRTYSQSIQTSNLACESGGTMSASGTADESGGDMSMVYDNCCVQDCCYVGTAVVVYGKADEGSYSYCASFEMAYSCNGRDELADYATCAQTDGTVAYSVKVGDTTFTVTGSYADGSGALTISGANGTWYCSYSEAAGSCTGPGGEFSF